MHISSISKTTPDVVLVTGGGRGIGAACCIALAEAGYDVALNYNHDEQAAQSVVQAVQTLGRTARAYQLDLGGATAGTEIVAAVAADFGRLDALVSNAGIAPVVAIDDITPEDWDRVLAVNLRSAFFAAQAAFRLMRARGRGKIVFLSSQAGQAGGVFVGAHYVASKAGVVGLTKSFAKAGAPHGILVNCVSPGQVDTPMTSTFPAERVRALTESVPLKRIGRPQEVAAVVRFLFSEAASYITGATIPVNGGLLMP